MDTIKLVCEYGGLVFIPEDIKPNFVEWLILCYIGEPGGYGYHDRYRKVFYSNSGAPLSFEFYRMMII